MRRDLAAVDVTHPQNIITHCLSLQCLLTLAVLAAASAVCIVSSAVLLALLPVLVVGFSFVLTYVCCDSVIESNEGFEM